MVKRGITWQTEALVTFVGMERAVYPLSWTTGLKLSLVLLAAFGFVTVVIKALPQLVSGVPAHLPLVQVWS